MKEDTVEIGVFSVCHFVYIYFRVSISTKFSDRPTLWEANIDYKICVDLFNCNFSHSRVWLSHSERPVKYILHLEYLNNDFLSSRNSFPATIYECKHITGFMSKRIREMHHKRSRRS